MVVGLARDRIEGFSMGLFEVGMVGLPVLMAGLLYLVSASAFLLPDRNSVTAALERPREFLTVMFVRKSSEPDGTGYLEGKTVAQAGLRSLPGLYLVRIERENGATISAPSPDEILQGGDKLFFAGIVDSVLALRQIKGLRLADDAVRFLVFGWGLIGAAN